MLLNFTIERFRSINRCELKDLKRITLLTGKNNTGKSAVIEAMFIHSGNYNPNLVMVVNGMRGLNTFVVDSQKHTPAPWKSIFHNFDETQPVRFIADVSHDAKQAEPINVTLAAVVNQTELSGLSAQLRMHVLKNAIIGPSKILRLDISKGRKARNHGTFHLLFDDKQAIVYPSPPSPEYATRLLYAGAKEQPGTMAQQFATFQMEGKTAMIVDALKPMEPRLLSLEVVYEGEPLLHGNIGLSSKRLIPLPLMGDGLNRVTALILAIGACRGGTVLVDDIDTGLHYSIMKEFWQSIFNAAKQFDVQIVATTHSAEMAEACLEAANAENQSNEFCVIRLERHGERILSNYYTAGDVAEAIDAGFEVR